MQNTRSKARSSRIDRMAVVVLSVLVTLVVAWFVIVPMLSPLLDAAHTLNSTLDQAGQFLCSGTN